MEEQGREFSLAWGAGQPLPLSSAVLWEPVWAAASAGRAPGRQLGTETRHGQPPESQEQDKPLVCKAFSSGGSPFVTYVLF